MKKITQVAETGGARIDFDDFRDVFNKEMWDVMQAMMSGFDSDTQGVIVSGCTISGSVGNYTISSGIVYLDGEFRRFTQQTGLSLPQYIKAATDVNTTRTFEDTLIKTLYITKSSDLATSVPGSGQYLAFTTTTDADDRRYSNILDLIDNSVISTLTSGTYTPTITNVTNVAASTAYICQYLRVGSIVTVSGKVSIDPTAGTASTELEMSLPIASDFTAQEQCGGTAVNNGSSVEAASIRAQTTNNRALFFYRSAGTAANEDFFFSFTYRII